MKKLIVITIALLLAGCNPDPTQVMSVSPSSEYSQDGISVTRVGVFKDDTAYHDLRAVYRIKDQRTGKEFIGVSGVGISEVGSHSTGKTTTQDER